MSEIHSVTDKALYDALCQSRVTDNDMIDLFLSRGILVSKKTDRKKLAKNFSKLTHDYYLHQKISTIFGGFLRREKSTSLVVNNSVDKKLLLKAANDFKEILEGEDDHCFVISDKNLIRINITYLSTNFGKSDFNQVEKKTALFDIEMLDDGFSIRRPDNEQSENYNSQLLAIIETLVDKDNKEKGIISDTSTLDIESINLSNIEDAEKRTDFFKRLINGLDGYELDDVTDVFIYHPKPSVLEEEDGDSETGIHISKASLKGEGVLKSIELRSLYERGFYIWKIRWRVKDKSKTPDLYDFEAQFGDPLEFKDFSYISRGVKKYKGANEYNKNPIQLPDEQEYIFKRLIEKVARSIIIDINNEYI
ncbi:hypothetical protein NB694_004394 [Pantoea ananatis]|uniref:hypothetical protein n=1 Tax=Pantoea ananas TaxID=553 RepID=UPI0021F701CA|nr:hypothetical protein [Pantoea ananatis]MCW0314594.1 hypothetical protein [Pantoea ananatis]